MAVAPSSTNKYHPRSVWSAGPPPLTSYQTASHTVGNALENPVGLVKSGQQQSVSLWFPVALGVTFGLLIGGVTLGAVVTLWLTSPAKTTTTTAVPIVTAFWSFDNNTNDLYNTYNGVAVNAPTYVTGYTGLPDMALNFVASSSQYVTVASPFLNLTYNSFTVEMWFYPTALGTADYGLFGQCQTTSMDLCLIYTIRNYKAYLSFTRDDQSGVTTLSTNIWYHVAFVYDYTASTQYVYLNGILEGSRSSNSYQGMSGAILIGATDNGARSYFSGYIDQVSFITRATSAADILNAATLVCYYPFDFGLYSDAGPLGLNGVGVNVSIAVGFGRVNDAISFPVASSYFVLGTLNKLGIVGQSYSMALWIEPTSVSGGTIVHVSSCNYNCGGRWCLAFIGLTSGGQIAIQSWRNNGSNLVSLTGPTLSVNVWTHVVQTYSSTNGMCLYVNGLLLNQSSAFTYWAGNRPDYIFLGSFPIPACVGFNVISVGQYYGLLDEFRLYSREITATEVYTLANP